MASDSPLIGIDLGTTHSLCAVFANGAPQLIPNAHGAPLTPSVVGVLEDGQVVVGETARQWRVTNPEATAAQFKRWMGEDREVILGSKSFSPAELSSLVLRALKNDAEAFLGMPIEEAVITVPAYFNEHQRLATRAAGEMAGLKVRRIVNEPTAAALSYGFHQAQAIENLLIFDLGGGTFDVTVMEIFEGTLEILATAGESRLGGEDFTDRIVQWALTQVGKHLEHVEMTEPLLVARLRDEAEIAKRKLSEEPTASLRMPDKQGTVGPDAKRIEISREEFHKACQSLSERIQRPTERAMRDAGLSWDKVHAVILVGGATRMPVVRTLLHEWSNQEPRSNLDPDHVVALGASIQAALIQDDKAVEDLVMTDVCPYTLGIEIIKELGSQVMDGYYMPIVHRNTTIPVSKEEVVNTIRDNQQEILVQVFQGEARKVEGNLKLGELRVTGIPPGPAGQPIQIRFTYDLNGLLEVEAIVSATNAKFETLLQHNVKGLSAKEIRAAHKRMKELKFYPRDDLENQRLLRFAESVVKELDKFQRGNLEESIDTFEAAMNQGDRERFASVREHLMITLSGLGFPIPDLSTDSQSDNNEAG